MNVGDRAVWPLVAPCRATVVGWTGRAAICTRSFRPPSKRGEGRVDQAERLRRAAILIAPLPTPGPAAPGQGHPKNHPAVAIWGPMHGALFDYREASLGPSPNREPPGRVPDGSAPGGPAEANAARSQPPKTTHNHAARPQKRSVLCLRVLQAALVYVNTLV
jgi:hypothetical protein